MRLIDTIPHYHEKKPLVGVVGEIYVRSIPFATTASLR